MWVHVHVGSCECLLVILRQVCNIYQEVLVGSLEVYIYISTLNGDVEDENLSS